MALLEQTFHRMRFRMQFFDLLEAFPQHANSRPLEQAADLLAFFPLFGGLAVEEGLGDLHALAAKQVEQHVQAAKVRDGLCGLIAAAVSSSDGGGRLPLSVIKHRRRDVSRVGKVALAPQTVGEITFFFGKRGNEVEQGLW